MERELVKIASDNPAHPKGYYIQFKDCMKPGDVEFGEELVRTVSETVSHTIDTTPIKGPIKLKKKRK